jgi:hypothetical protein
MRKRVFAIVLLSFIGGGVFAGDEVDYSAPYMTLEDGKLVTKYPAKEHDPNTPQPNNATTDTSTSAPPEQPTPLGIVLAFALIALAVFLSRGSVGKSGP